jgi:hypothetical protein
MACFNQVRSKENLFASQDGIVGRLRVSLINKVIGSLENELH